MKPLFLVLLLTFSATFVSAQTDEAYQNALRAAIAEYPNTSTAAAMQALAAKFERLSAARDKDWHPKAWQVLCYYNSFYMTNDTDKREGLVAKAEPISAALLAAMPNDEEIVLLHCFVLQAKAMLSPTTSWMTVGPEIKKLEKKAEGLNANNPRLMLKKIQNLYYTPAMFGGDKTAACSMTAAAREQFGKHPKKDELGLDWGLIQLGLVEKECAQLSDKK